MIHVIAIITTRPGERAAVLEAFAELVPLVRAEPGCIEYAPVVDASDAGAVQTPLGPDTYVVVEKWESTAALQAHLESPHLADYAQRVKGRVASRVIHVLSPVS